MFKRHSLEMKVVKTPRKPSPGPKPVECTHFNPELISKIVKDNVKHTAVALVAVVASVTVLKTASEIAINICPKN